MDTIKKLISLVIVGAFVLGAAACLPQSLPLNEPTATAAETTAVTQTVIPATSIPDIAQLPLFGVGMDRVTSGWGLEQMVAAKTSWLRLPGVMWSDVEPTQGTYDWSTLSGLETDLKTASSKGIQVVLLVHSTPEWARKIAGTGPTCGPIAADKLSAFGDFMHALVARYSAAPYNVKYWELWNEEDVDPSLVPADSGFGCWGDQTDEYYGGGYYAEMLKAVYPQIKVADPQSEVLIGGLLLDCDPRLGAGCDTVGHSTLPLYFLEGILRKNGGRYFDGISFHSYDYYMNKFGQYGNSTWQSAWNTTGPVLITKVQFIQSLLSRYSVSGKFLMNSELALLCDSCEDDQAFETTKAYYLAQAHAAALAEGIRANIWYSVLGWRNSGLLNRNLQPRPAYLAFQFARWELSDLVFIREITDYSGLMGYEYQRDNHRMWVLWSLDGAEHGISLDTSPMAVLDVYGIPLPPSAVLHVTLTPLYVEW